MCDRQLKNVGWDIVARNKYLPNSTYVVKEAFKILFKNKLQNNKLERVGTRNIAVICDSITTIGRTETNC